MSTRTILSKFSSPSALTITLASLASSTGGVGRQSTLVDNSATKHQRFHGKARITTNAATAVTINTAAILYLIKCDGVHYTDGAGGDEAAWTRVNAKAIGVINITATTVNTGYDTDFMIVDPGPYFAIGVVQNSGQTLHGTAANHYITILADDDDIQAEI